MPGIDRWNNGRPAEQQQMSSWRQKLTLTSCRPAAASRSLRIAIFERAARGGREARVLTEIRFPCSRTTLLQTVV